MNVSIILPARNEADSLRKLLPEIKKVCPQAEILVINDGSTDSTIEVCNEAEVRIFSHQRALGNGAAIKAGARQATGDIYIFMDADGQHLPEYIPEFLKKMKEGYDMVIGARNQQSHAGKPRYIANVIYNKLATYMSGHDVKDLTSGFRAVKADAFKRFLYLLPNGFSYPTTITMAMFRSGYQLDYLPIDCNKREGSSHIKLLQDGVKFLLIIFRVTSLYSPLKIFAPISLFLFTMGLSYYAYTFLLYSRFTNMSMLLLVSSIIIFLIGLISEQITFLLYSQIQKEDKN